MISKQTQDTLVLNLAEDAYAGDAQFTVDVDGVDIAGVFTATADRSTGELAPTTIMANLGAGPHAVTITLLNGVTGGTSDTTRDLYVASASLDGNTVGVGSVLTAQGTTTQFMALAPLDTLEMNIDQDGFSNAQFTVSVDGIVLDSTFGTGSQFVQSQYDQIFANGRFGAGPHTVTISELANGADDEGNIHVQSVTFDGVTQALNAVVAGAGASTSFTVGDPAAVVSPASTDTTVTTPASPVAPDPTTPAPDLATAPAPTPDPASTPVGNPVTTGPDTLVLTVAEDAYQGDAEFNIFVDGQQLGGTYTATALRDAGATETITLNGDFGAGQHTVQVELLNGYTGGSQFAIRDLAISSASLNGETIGLGTVLQSQDPAGQFIVQQPRDTLVLYVSQANGQGNARITVSVDGVATGQTYTINGQHAQGQSDQIAINGRFGAGPHTILITDVSTAGAGGAPFLFVEMASFNGVRATIGSTLTGTGATATIMAGGSLASPMAGTVTAPTVGNAAAADPVPDPVSTPTPDPEPTTAMVPLGASSDQTPDTTTTGNLVIGVSEDAYQGDALFTVAIDGTQVDGTFSATASHAGGLSSDVTIPVTLAPGPHSVTVTFENDAFGGPGLDRNLYVDSIAFNGVTQPVGASLYTQDASVTLSVGTADTTQVTLPLLGTTPTPTPTPDAVTTPLPAQGTGSLEYLGVNLSGAEFGVANATNGGYDIGTDGTDYTYPTHAELDYYASEGLNVIRLPFLWERLQPVEGGKLDPTQLGYIDDVVKYAATKGITVDLDPHNYGYGYGNLIGSDGTPDSAFASLWGQLAGHFAGQSNVMFGLMNEPHVQSPSDWVAPVNDAIAAIRAAGATQEILVPGTDWTGGDTWITSGNAALFAANVIDPGHNMAFEIHQYSDADGSGASQYVVSPTIGEERLQDVTAWAQATGNKLFLGEFGASQDPTSLTNLTNMLGYMQQNSNVWQGGTEWGGGPWWGNYYYGLDPQNGATTPQVAILSSFAPKTATA